METLMNEIVEKRTGPANRTRCQITTENTRWLFALVLAIATASPVFAQASPWETAVQNLQTSFTGPIAKGLSLVALVVGGLMFAYSEGSSKKVFAGIVFGLGMALGAANFMAWMFP
jgi:type IV secretion system protein TrbC